jgi:hypothetical protein
MTGMYFPEKKLAYAMSIIYKTVNYISIKYKKYHVTFSQNCIIYFQNKMQIQNKTVCWLYVSSFRQFISNIALCSKCANI